MVCQPPRRVAPPDTTGVSAPGGPVRAQEARRGCSIKALLAGPFIAVLAERRQAGRPQAAGDVAHQAAEADERALRVSGVIRAVSW